MITNGVIILIMFGNFFYAYRCIFQTQSYIQQYGFGEGSAIMTRLVGTFAAGFAVTLAIALLTSIEGAWLLFVYGFVQACMGAGGCSQTIPSHRGSVEGLQPSAEGYIAPSVVTILPLLVLIIGWRALFNICNL